MEIYTSVHNQSKRASDLKTTVHGKQWTKRRIALKHTCRCIDIHMYANVCVCACMHACMHACMYLYIHTHTHTDRHTHTHISFQSCFTCSIWAPPSRHTPLCPYVLIVRFPPQCLDLFICSFPLRAVSASVHLVFTLSASKYPCLSATVYVCASDNLLHAFLYH